jgi:hypothetical protein
MAEITAAPAYTEKTKRQVIRKFKTRKRGREIGLPFYDTRVFHRSAKLQQSFYLFASHC